MNIQQLCPNLNAVLNSWQHQKGATILMQIVPLIISAPIGAKLGFYEGLRRTPEQFSRLANISSISDAASAIFGITSSLLTHSVGGFMGGGLLALDAAAKYIRQNSNVDELNARPDIRYPEDDELVANLSAYFAEHPGEL